MASAKIGGCKKLRRIARHKDYYAQQVHITAMNKARRATKRANGRAAAKLAQEAKELAYAKRMGWDQPGHRHSLPAMVLVANQA